MLGEKITEGKGKVTVQRVVSVGDQGPTVETSFQGGGTVLGVEYSEFGTYTAVQRPGGFLQGEGQGVMMTKDGDTVTWVGHGIGRFTGPGSLSWRGSFIYRTSSERLARLNGLVAVFEDDMDAEGNSYGKSFEWK